MAKRHTDYSCGTGCPVEATLEIIGGKWKGGLLFHLSGGERRYSELRRAMPNVSPRILAKALRELEADGVIARTVYPTVPPQVGYRLSASGEALRPAIALLAGWGRARLAVAPELAAAE
ncbi:winged helix-turn-helix transcriptional regulator [Ancylobacter lacus]|uniref:winged helix-turn-helix transcriptional regulator n=1 Tax=Ancylobacter lacus TaxID=2579970 RepID=UPI001BD18618|nr:helix-turn-helix domain-containing protein [Ancylobacter lacus]MBS7541313.1 helix-turn-helix transcriptional regulator [Ancylobacter lacus]